MIFTFLPKIEMSHEGRQGFESHEDARSNMTELPIFALSEINPSIDSNNRSIETSSGFSHDSCSSFTSKSLVEANQSTSSTELSMNTSNTDISVSEMEIIERMETIMKAMREMFASFFHPEGIVNSLYNLDEHEQKSVLSDSLCSTQNGMRLLIERLPELDNAVQLEFYRLITHFDKETGFVPQSLLSGAGAKKQAEISYLMQLVKKIADGVIIKRLTSSDIVKIIDILVQKDLINKSKKSIGGENPCEDFMILLRQVKRKPDCPFEFWRILQGVRPDLFSSRNNGCLSDAAQSSSLGNVQNENEACGQLTGEKKSTPQQTRLCQQLHVKPKDMGGQGIQMIIQGGAMSLNQITTEEREPVSKVPSWNVHKASLSDDENDDDQELDETLKKVPFVDDQDVDLKLRNYQKELTQAALEGHNTIICAPTGSGKTRVALDIMIKHLKKGNDAEQKRRKVCFLARTIPLANQQYEVICKHLPEMYKANIFTGQSEGNSSMHLLLDELDVVVLTPMVLQNNITFNNVKDLTVFSLLIFDECHHTREKEPYQTLMSSYVDMKLKGKKDLPQVVGLTASFPVEKANREDHAARSILQLCANLDASTISVVEKYKEELKQTVAVPTESYDYLYEQNSDPSFEKIITVMRKLEKEAQHCAKDIGDNNIIGIIGKMPQNKKEQRYNNWAVELLQAAEEVPRSAKETNMPVRLLIIIAKYLTTYHFALETHDLVHLIDVGSYLDKCFAENKDLEDKTIGETRFYDYFKDLQECLVKLGHNDNPNLLKLIDVIEKNIFKGNIASRGIIFVRTRAIAEALVSWLNRCSYKNVSSLKAHIFTGTNAKESQGGMTQSQQNDLVEDFRKGKVKLLVATSVAEEGLDVPECNLVIKYNHVGNEITTIQTRGRSRKAGGQSILLAMKEICNREIINKRRTQLMYKGIEIVREKTREEFSREILQIQKVGAEKREIDEILASQVKEKWRNKKFKLFCRLCRQFCVESVNIRTVCRNHRIVLNRDVWNQVHAQPMDPTHIDGTEFVGSVRCRCDVEDGKKCNRPLGVMIYYYNVYFLALSIKNYIVEVEEEEGQMRTKTVKKWKDLPYPIEELTFEDIKNYISPKEANPIVDQATEQHETYLSSYAASLVSTESQAGSENDASYASARSGATAEILNRYQLDVDPASMSPDSSRHETHRKEFVDVEKDSGFSR